MEHLTEDAEVALKSLRIKKHLDVLHASAANKHRDKTLFRHRFRRGVGRGASGGATPGIRKGIAILCLLKQLGRKLRLSNEDENTRPVSITSIPKISFSQNFIFAQVNFVFSFSSNQNVAATTQQYRTGFNAINVGGIGRLQDRIQDSCINSFNSTRPMNIVN